MTAKIVIILLNTKQKQIFFKGTASCHMAEG